MIASTPNNAIRVFTEPTRGWTRTVQPTTTLHPPRHGLFAFSGAVAISQRTIVAASDLSARGEFIGAYVFDEPRGGWRSRRVTARTVKTVAPTYPLGPDVAVSGSRIAVSVGAVGKDEKQCPCGSEIYIVPNHSRNRSAGTTLVTRSALLTVPESPWIAISGRTLAASSADGIQTYAISSSG